MMRHTENNTDKYATMGFIAALLMATPARPQTKLSAELAPLNFLVGDWIGDEGHAEGGQTARGTFSIAPVAGGRGLLRRDHTALLDSSGHVTQSFEQIMMIYPELGHLHGDYFDGTHAIHYVDAVTVPQGTAIFTTAMTPGMPAFRLTYTQTSPAYISIRFEIRVPGSSTFQVIAEGKAHRAA